MKEELGTTMDNIQGKSRSLFCPGSGTVHPKQLNMLFIYLQNEKRPEIIGRNSAI